jgi:hypothetical protein
MSQDPPDLPIALLPPSTTGRIRHYLDSTRPYQAEHFPEGHKQLQDAYDKADELRARGESSDVARWSSVMGRQDRAGSTPPHQQAPRRRGRALRDYGSLPVEMTESQDQYNGSSRDPQRQQEVRSESETSSAERASTDTSQSERYS